MQTHIHTRKLFFYLWSGKFLERWKLQNVTCPQLLLQLPLQARVSAASSVFVNLVKGNREMTKVALCSYFSVYMLGNICAKVFIHCFQLNVPYNC